MNSQTGNLELVVALDGAHILANRQSSPWKSSGRGCDIPRQILPNYAHTQMVSMATCIAYICQGQDSEMSPTLSAG